MPRASQATIRRVLMQDPILAEVVSAIGPLRSQARDQSDLEAACRIIAGQQLSAKAASTIWSRVKVLCLTWEPAEVASLADDDLRACGLSRNKAAFIRGAAACVVAGTLDFTAIRSLDDAAAVTALRTIKGFGPWSIEMFLMFSLERPDLFSMGDAGLRRAIMLLYQVPKVDYDRRVAAITDRWRPYRSHACRYLWAWLDRQ